MRAMLITVCIFLAGCFSVDVTRHEAFADVIGKELRIQRPSLISMRTIMKSAALGGNLAILVLREVPPDYQERVAKGWEVGTIQVPAGTQLRVDRIERRNLIDAGVELLAFGEIGNPQSQQFEPFVFELTRNLGDVLVRAPWEGLDVPGERQWETTGPRGMKVSSQEKKG